VGWIGAQETVSKVISEALSNCQSLDSRHRRREKERKGIFIMDREENLAKEFIGKRRA
jgi:hypothetical protein